MNIATVYEDEDLLVFNKPAGIITHPKNIDDKQDSVTGWLIKKYPYLKNVGEPFIASEKEIPRAGVAHRLDKETSGLLIAAKNNKAFFYLKNLFQERKIRKYYLALVIGIPKESKGMISAPLGRLGLKRTTRIMGKKLIDKKEAVTEYKVLKTYNFGPATYSLLEVTPLTGRTHQIRVHLHSIGHPIVCDKIYGGKKKICPVQLNRLFLHAQKLEFTSPSGQRLHLEVELPNELTSFLNSLTISP